LESIPIRIRAKRYGSDRIQIHNTVNANSLRYLSAAFYIKI
jgi:hypothetical protein